MKTRYWVLIFAAVALVCAGAMALTGQSSDAPYAEVYSGGELVARLDLSRDQELTVDSRNTVTVKDGKVAVTWADCPDQYCVQRGYCSGGNDIVCLPNRLVITFVGGEEVDAVIG